MLTIRPEETGFSSERLERIPTVMQRFVDRGDLAGALTLLARHGQVFHCATTGLMDIDRPAAAAGRRHLPLLLDDQTGDGDGGADAAGGGSLAAG